MRFIKYLSVVILLAGITACQSTDDDEDYAELTPSEYKQLLKKARVFVAIAPVMKLTPISDEDKRFINTHEPKFYPRYYGDKSGVFKMVWRINPGYSVRVIGKGTFLDPSCKFRLTVSRFAQ